MIKLLKDSEYGITVDGKPVYVEIGGPDCKVGVEHDYPFSFNIKHDGISYMLYSEYQDEGQPLKLAPSIAVVKMNSAGFMVGVDYFIDELELPDNHSVLNFFTWEGKK